MKRLLCSILCTIILSVTKEIDVGPNGCPINWVKCQGICYESQALCPIEITCTGSLIKVNQFTCARDESFQVPSKCKADEGCWDETCSEGKDQCPTMPTCPSAMKVRCPDNSCVPLKENCPSYFDCPPFLPIRCPNGDCRTHLDDCPGAVRCPDKYPMLCNDGSCRISPEDCEITSTQSQCIDTSMTRCPDGSCTSSKFLCPTPLTCPKGLRYCAGGTCAPECVTKTPEEGKEPENPSSNSNGICSTAENVYCPLEHVCKTSLSLCGTGIICPLDKPVKCWDSSCKESISKCPPYQKCAKGFIECPDGSCVKEKSKCGTPITCSLDAPFKCYDNTCKRNPKDCLVAPNCPSSTPIFCWDGKCVVDRTECVSDKNCADNELKCPDNICHSSAEECKIQVSCPSSFVECPNGSCRKKIADCESPVCPQNFPYQCSNGLCVKEEKNCDETNGCPGSKPYKCKDGSCGKAESDCKNKLTPCENKKTCDDGSCVPNDTACPTSNGCNNDTPKLCADGICVKESAKCTIPVCPKETPVKCLNGLCVVTISNCPYLIGEVSKGSITCADGTERAYYEECKPLSSCKNNKVRCPNGSCNDNLKDCPSAKTCPLNQVRCENGLCAASLDNCIEESGCPKKYPYKCPKSGLCTTKAEDCNIFSEEYNLGNGCPQASPYLCITGKCVTLKDECNAKESVEKPCPSETPQRCLNGSCKKTMRECAAEKAECIPEFPYECLLDNQCVSSIKNCLNVNKCPVDAPFRCLTGECKKYPLKTSDNDVDGCDIGIRCPNYKPYLCADGSCAEKSSFCLTLEACPDNKPFRCFDRTCVVDQSDCAFDTFRCPAKNPILCPNSNCVSNYNDCFSNGCPSWNPYLCLNGKCVKKPEDCQQIIAPPASTTRLLAETQTTVTCSDKEVMCSDSSCRPNEKDCPLFNGCVLTDNPVKCADGFCAKTINDCTTPAQCADSMKRCEDGICRKKCFDYNGCKADTPLMCTTGRCVKNIAECVGESYCLQSSLPYRCPDGSCAEKLENCKSTFKSHGNSNIRIGIFPKTEVRSSCIIGESNDNIGSIYIASDSLIKNGQPAVTTMNMKSVARNLVVDTFGQYDGTRKNDVMKVLPFADEKTVLKLEYEYLVLSSVVEITLNDPKVEFRNYILLNLAYDFPYLHESFTKTLPKLDEIASEIEIDYGFKPLSSTDDICLGKLDKAKKEWKCVGLGQQAHKLVRFELEAPINQPGIYAVILNPKANEQLLVLPPHFLIDNLLALSIGIGVSLIVIAGAVYGFIRVVRYRRKYKETKENLQKSSMELKEMDNLVGGQVGQSIGDAKEGTVFTENPAFQLVKGTKETGREMQLQSLIDSYIKNLKKLERNNVKLRAQHETLNYDYERLKKYKDSWGNNGDEVAIVFEKKS